MTRKRLLKTFSHMKERCYDEKNKAYKNYGGRGITICQEWLDDREKFIKWALENGYQEHLSIDRTNNDGNYEPSNCRWVTISENNQNRRSCKYYTLNGRTQNLQQWCNEYKVNRSMVDRRLSLGWEFEKALFSPKRQRDTETIVGQKFGKLKVLEFYGEADDRQSKFKCLCDCGKTTIVKKNKLISGHTRSCGCLRKETAKMLFKKSN